MTPPWPGSGSDHPGEPFEPTRWSVVLAAGRDADSPEAARAALARLCQTYWTPLYGFIRGRGHSLHDAQDLTQGFFAHLIEHQIYTRTDPGKGKFRSFLLASLKNFLHDAYDRERAAKRGGACEFLPLHEQEAVAAEALFQSSAAPGMGTSADQIFERQWAETLVGAALRRLADEFSAGGREPLFGALEVFLRGSAGPPPTYDQLAARLGMPTATVRSHVTRLRARYRVLLRAELRRTVDSDAEVDEELGELVRVLTAR